MSARYLGHLHCPRCGHNAAEDRAALGCRGCASAGVGVNLQPVYERRPGPLPHSADEQGIFAFRELLPLSSSDAAISLGEGRTPLIALERLGAQLGLNRLLLKDEARNPTWSYKDRLAAVAVTKAAASGASTVVVSSTGNHGAAVAAYAAAAGLSCVVLTLASVPREMSVLMRSYGAHVVAYEKSPDRWTAMRAAINEFGWVPISGLLNPPIGSNPFGIDGYKTIAYELWQQLGESPDVVVAPAAYGDGLSGICRGFADLKVLGLISRAPRLVAVDPFGAYAAGLKAADGALPTVPTRPSVAFSVATPVATYQGVAALRATNGAAVAEPDSDKIVAMQLELARREGLYVENAAALTVLAAKQLTEQKWIKPDDIVVVLSTSTGLKDPNTTAAHLSDARIVDSSLAGLETALPRAMRS